LEKNTFSFVMALKGVVELTVWLLFGMYPALWAYSGGVITSVGYSTADNDIVHALVFVVLSSLIDTVTSLPFNIYSTFVSELARH
jgi:STE24 endopeptidase